MQLKRTCGLLILGLATILCAVALTLLGQAYHMYSMHTGALVGIRGPNDAMVAGGGSAQQAKRHFAPPWRIEPKELQVILRHLQGIDSYLEWGSGGSTFHFTKYARVAASIEHNEKWCASVRHNLLAGGAAHVDYHCVPTSNPMQIGGYDRYAPYVNEVSKLGREQWDVVFIDGRARVACAVRALPLLHAGSIVLLHDFARKRYWGVLKYYDVVERVPSRYTTERGLVVLRRKKEYAWMEGRDEDAVSILERDSAKGLL